MVTDFYFSAGNRSIFSTAYCSAGEYPPQQKRWRVFEAPYRGNKPLVKDQIFRDSSSIFTLSNKLLLRREPINLFNRVLQCGGISPAAKTLARF